MVTQGKTNLSGNKYSLWRSNKIGADLDSSLYMNTDDVSVISSYFEKKIFVVSPVRGSNGSSKIEVRLHIPVRGTKIVAKTFRLEVESNFDL